MRTENCVVVELQPWPDESSRAIQFWGGGDDATRALQRERRCIERAQKSAHAAAHGQLRYLTFVGLRFGPDVKNVFEHFRTFENDFKHKRGNPEK